MLRANSSKLGACAGLTVLADIFPFGLSLEPIQVRWTPKTGQPDKIQESPVGGSQSGGPVFGVHLKARHCARHDWIHQSSRGAGPLLTGLPFRAADDVSAAL